MLNLQKWILGQAGVKLKLGEMRGGDVGEDDKFTLFGDWRERIKKAWSKYLADLTKPKDPEAPPPSVTPGADDAPAAAGMGSLEKILTDAGLGAGALSSLGAGIGALPAGADPLAGVAVPSAATRAAAGGMARAQDINLRATISIGEHEFQDVLLSTRRDLIRAGRW